MKKITVFMSNRERFLGLCYLAFQNLILPDLLRSILTIFGISQDDAVLNLLFFAVNFLAVAILFRKFWAASWKDFAAKAWPCIWKAAAGLLVCKIAVLLLNLLLQLWQPDYFQATPLGPALRNPNDMHIGQMVQSMPILFSIATVFLVPPVEEAFYRGLIFGGLYRKNKIVAYAVSVLLFSVIHILGYLNMGDPMLLSLCFAQYVIPALCLCLLYGMTGSVFSPILMHMAYNAIGILFVR